jgi:hypothetical protein
VLETVLLLLLLRVHVVPVLVIGLSMAQMGEEIPLESLVIYFAVDENVRNLQKFPDITHCYLPSMHILLRLLLDHRRSEIDIRRQYFLLILFSYPLANNGAQKLVQCYETYSIHIQLAKCII